MAANNLIQFPIGGRPQIDREKLLADEIIDVSLEISLGVFNVIEEIFLEDALATIEHQKDYVFIHEAIKSAIARRYGKQHRLQKYVEENIDINSSDIKWLQDDPL